jgi:LysM repeat protein
MVSNQAVRRFPGRAFGLLGGLSVLALTSGCQILSRAESAPEPVAAPQARPAPVVAAPPQSAVDAAIAKAGTEPQQTVVVPAPAPVMNPSAPLNYTVKRGDTLWDISAMYLRDPWLWPEIWHVNPAVQNPHLIYPGDVLTLARGANGEPQITLVRGNALRVQPLIRSTPLEGPIATIPYDAIKAFLGKPSIVSKDDLKNAPRVAGLRDRHMVAGAGHEFYVKGMLEHGPGRYSVVRVGEELKDPESGKVLGYMGTYTGAARIDQIAELSKAQLIDSARETTAGDLLFAEDTQTVSSDLLPRAPPAGVNGQIMAVVDGVSLIGSNQVVAVNRGSKHGLETGHVLAIYENGEVVADGSCKQERWAFCGNKTITLPSERAGSLLIFKTYEQMSYGLVVNTTVPVRVTDQVRTP